MYVELIIWGALAAFILLFVSTAFLEKQRLHDFVPAPGDEPTTDSPYFNAMNDAALRLGFTSAGVFIQNRASKMYRAKVAVWISPEREILLRIAGGKTARVPIRRTLLISIVQSDHILQTQDDFGMADLSGLTGREVVLNADLDELLVRHRQRIASNSGSKRLFSPSNALYDWESIEAMKSQQMARLGLIKFLNREESVWRHTLKGAWLQYYKGLRGQLAEGKSQIERVSRKRPGST